MLIDTDVLIWAIRGYRSAIEALDAIDQPALSIVTVIELMQGARDQQEMRDIEMHLWCWGAEVIALDAQISKRARHLIRDYAHSHGLQLADALIAATAIVHEYMLMSGNRKHFDSIAGLNFTAFRPLRD
jgi:predicted nucleic acid-binding protein